MLLDMLLPKPKGHSLATAISGGHPRDPVIAQILGFGSRTASGVPVNECTALESSAVWAATRIISESIAQLPSVLYRGTDKSKVHAYDHPLYRVLKTAPNPDMDDFKFFDYMTGGLVNYGNCYAEKVWIANKVAALYPIHPSRVPKSMSYIDEDTGERVYVVLNDNGSQTHIAASDMLHVSGPMLGRDGVFGKGVIEVAADSIGLALAMELYGATFFSNGARPSAILKHKTNLTEAAQKRLRESWREIHGSVSQSHEIAILEEDMDLEPWGVEPQKSQFVEGRQFQINEIARWYRVPPHMLGDLSRATHSNIEAENIGLVTHTLMPWIRRYESAFQTQCLSRADQEEYFVRFLVQAFMRGDSKARAEFYKEMHGTGTFSTNDILELEDRNPIGPIGDTRYVNAASIPLHIAAEGKHLTKMQESQDKPADDSTDGPEDDEADLGIEITGLIARSHDAEMVMLRGLTETATSTLSTVAVQSDTQKRLERGIEVELPAVIEKAVGEQELRFESMAAAFSDMAKEVKEYADKARGGAIYSCRIQLEAAATRMLNKEIQAATRAAKEPKRFLSWLDEFYPKHGEQFADSIDSICEAVRAIGIHVESASLATWHCDESYAQLLSLAGESKSDELEQSVGTLTSQWQESRVKLFVEHVFEKGQNDG